jgi:hypothetical protein
VAGYRILLSRGHVQVAGEVDGLLASHRVLTGPATGADRYSERPVVHVRRAEARFDPGPHVGAELTDTSWVPRWSSWWSARRTRRVPAFSAST